MSKCTHSGKANPCPICSRTKDGDCRWNAEVVFCHTHIDDVGIEGYTYRGSTNDGLWGQYFPKTEPEPKPIRPVGRKNYFYNGQDGQRLVRVERIDGGDGSKDFKQYHWNGKKWVPGVTDDVKKLIHLYRIQDPINQDAITTGKPLLFVEGEGLVDLLLPIGIAATTAIGGSGKWKGYGYPNYLKDLAGANLVLAPDRDKPGVKHCEDVTKDFPNAKWLYAFPHSLLWEHLPAKHGLDIADWVAKGATREDILSAIEPKRASSGTAEAEKNGSQETARELAELIALDSISCSKILPEQLLDPLRKLAQRLNVPVEAYVCTLLPVIASQLRTGTRIEIDPSTNFYSSPILWMGIVGESGSKKSPLIRAILSPLDLLQEIAEGDYQNKLNEHKLALETWEAQPKGKRGTKPKPPTAKEYYLSDFTMEALSAVVGAQQEEGLLINIDELARFFNTMDAYRNGKGGDRQHWLSFYDGKAFKSNRKSTGRIYTPKTSISLVGGIQPSIVQKIMMGDTSVEDGLWSRFAWVRIPLSVSPGILGSAKYDLTGLLKGLYQTLNHYQPTTYRLSSSSQQLWNQWHFEIEQRILKEPSSILRATYPKAKERAARIALVSHLAHAAVANVQPQPVIPEETLSKSIQFTRWLVGQTRLLYAEFGIADNPETTRILKFVNRFRGCGWITTRMVRNWTSGREKPSFDECRKFMAQVVSLRYAVDNRKQGSEYQIQVNQDCSHVVTEDTQNQFSQGLQPVTNSSHGLVTLVTNSDRNNPASDYSDCTSDYPVVTTEEQFQQGLQPSVTKMTTNQQIEICKAGANWHGFKVNDQVWLGYGKGQASIIDPTEYPELDQQPRSDMVAVRLASTGKPEWYPAAWVRRAS